MDIGVSIPTNALDAQPETAIAFARMAEEAGVDSIWVFDRLVFPNHEPLVTLSAIAAVTSRARIGTNILLAALRPPILLAKMIATIDQISGGRLILGVGSGARRDDFDAVQVPHRGRGERLEELIQVLQLAWSGRPVRHAGRFYNLNVGPIGPRPIQQPHPPIWMGGDAEPVLERVAHTGDGYLAGAFGGPEAMRRNWEQIQAHAVRMGRDQKTITLVAHAHACVDDDTQRAESIALKHYTRYYGPSRAQVQPWHMFGPPDHCISIAQQYRDAGADMLILGSVTAQPAYFERLCREVIPRLKGAS